MKRQRPAIKPAVAQVKRPLTSEEIAEREVLKERFAKDSALTDARAYFSDLKSELNHLLQDVERYERDWEETAAGKAYPNGEKKSPKLLVDILDWTVLATSGFRGQTEKAVRAAARIAAAYKFPF